MIRIDLVINGLREIVVEQGNIPQSQLLSYENKNQFSNQPLTFIKTIPINVENLTETQVMESYSITFYFPFQAITASIQLKPTNKPHRASYKHCH